MTVHSMTLGSIAARAAMLAALAFLFVTPMAHAQEVRVMTSGAFTKAFLSLVPEFERTTGTT